MKEHTLTVSPYLDELGGKSSIRDFNLTEMRRQKKESPRKPLATVLEFERRGDTRGFLVAVEAMESVPFAIERVFYIYGTITGARRGAHAHKILRQVLIAVSGHCTVLLDDGLQRTEEAVLDRPERGLLIEPGTWTELFDFTPDCVVLVLANRHYDEADYIRDYDAFVQTARSALR